MKTLTISGGMMKTALMLALPLAFASAAAQPQEEKTRADTALERADDPRKPSEFKFGEYHRSSKMTPGGSKGPDTWGDEGTDVGPPIPRGDDAAQTSGASDAKGGERDHNKTKKQPGARAKEGSAD